MDTLHVKVRQRKSLKALADPRGCAAQGTQPNSWFDPPNIALLHKCKTGVNSNVMYVK